MSYTVHHNDTRARFDCDECRTNHRALCDCIYDARRCLDTKPRGAEVVRDWDGVVVSVRVAVGIGAESQAYRHMRQRQEERAAA